MIAANIVRAMEERDISTAALSRKTGFHERAIRRWRKGTVAPSIESFEVLSEHLGHPHAWFCTDHKTEPEPTAEAA